IWLRMTLGTAPRDEILCYSGTEREGFEPAKRAFLLRLTEREGFEPAKRPYLFANSRRGRDSNPRRPYDLTCFRDRLLQPLGHLSRPLDSSTPPLACQRADACLECHSILARSAINTTRGLRSLPAPRIDVVGEFGARSMGRARAPVEWYLLAQWAPAA